jgi:hypothetical protein
MSGETERIYVAPDVPAEGEDLPRFIAEQLREIEISFIQMQSFLRLYAAARPLDRYKGATILYTDGTAWNPGDGPGLYYYDGSKYWKLTAVNVGFGQPAKGTLKFTGYAPALTIV